MEVSKSTQNWVNQSPTNSNGDSITLMPDETTTSIKTRTEITQQKQATRTTPITTTRRTTMEITSTTLANGELFYLHAGVFMKVFIIVFVNESYDDITVVLYF